MRESEVALSKLESCTAFLNANTILLYWSLADEIYTHEFIEKWKEKKTILLPIIDGESLSTSIYKNKESLQQGLFNIAEPKEELYKGSIDLAIIPGMAFDKEGNRLGRGKGYYDRFLSQTCCYKIGFCFRFQLLKTIPHEDFDIKMDEIISD